MKEKYSKKLENGSYFDVKKFIKMNGYTEEQLNLTLEDMEKRDISLLNDSEVFIERVKKAIESKEVIVNYSDYDADGFGSAVVAYKALRILGCKNNHYFTNKRSMGFGISREGIDQILEKHPDVSFIFTTDNGIVGFDAADYLADINEKKLIEGKKTIDLIITDHHEPNPDGTLPKAIGVVDAKRLDNKYPFFEWCGAGLIWKLFYEYAKRYGTEEQQKLIYNLLDYVALSTIGDVVPVIDENRFMIKEGLKMINEKKKITWILLDYVFTQLSGYDVMPVDEEIMGFSIVPAINAFSRIKNSIDYPIDLFIDIDMDTLTEEELNLRKLKSEEKDIEKLQEWFEGFAEMFKVNEERKLISQTTTDFVFENLDSSKRVIVYYQSQKELEKIIPNIESNTILGIVGIVSGKITENFHTTSFVLSDYKDGVIKGSARSIDGANVKILLDKVQEKGGYLIGYGGHEKAAGVTLPFDKLDDFIRDINEFADELDEEVFKRKNRYAVILNNIDKVNKETIDDIVSLKPFGERFEKPLVRINNVSGKSFKTLGEGGKHLKIKQYKSPNFEAILWGSGGVIEHPEFDVKGLYSIIGNLKPASFNNEDRDKINMFLRFNKDIVKQKEWI